jgi:hypothetical protein
LFLRGTSRLDTVDMMGNSTSTDTGIVLGDTNL